MVKRGNENAQMRKEDYEALESRGGGGGGEDEGGVGFERAPEDVRRKRRIVSARRPQGSTPGGTGGGDDDDNGGAKKSAFANFSFGAPTPAAANFSFSAQKSTDTNGSSGGASTPFLFGGGAAPAPAPATTGKAGFSFGGSSSAGGGTAAPAFSFTGGSSSTTGAASSAKPFSFGGGATTTTSVTPAGSELCQKYQKHANRLEDRFLEEVQNVDLKYSDISPLLNRYLDAVYVLEESYWGEKEELQKKGGSTTSASQNGAAGASTNAFLFGATPSAAPAPMTAFAGATPGTSLFGGNANAGATPAAASNAFASTAGTPGTLGEDGESMPSEPSELQEGDADKDYNVLETVAPGFVHFYVTRKGESKKLCGGGALKFQEHKTTGKRRMIMRNASSGKVLLNMSIDGIPYSSKISEPNRKYDEGLETVILKGTAEPAVGVETIYMRQRVRQKLGEPLLKTILEKCVK